MGVPQIIHSNRISPYKPSISGYPHLWKPFFKPILIETQQYVSVSENAVYLQKKCVVGKNAK